MESSMLKQAKRFLSEQKKNKQWQKVILCLGVIVAAGTMAVLMMPGQALNHTKKVLDCQYEVHEHTQECYDEDGLLICGMSDYVVHVHNEDCYDEAGVLVCPLPEVEEHEHTEECYQEERVLICGLEENAVLEQTEAPLVSDGDAVDGSALVVEEADTEGMEDEASAEALTGHAHTEECYETVRTLICDKAELHTHDEEECYDEDGNLICGLLALEEHVHGPECFKVVELTEEEVAGLNGNGTEELSSEENPSDDGLQEDAAEDETASDGETFDGDALTGDVSDGDAFVGDVSDEDVSGGDLLVYYCGLKAHLHEESCYDENGNLICGLEEHVHTEECLVVPIVTMTAEGTDYVITMTAPITSLPAAAEEISLQVKELTEADEDYVKAVEVMEDQLTNESRNHRVFDISLIYSGYEIEPIGPVNVTFTPKTQMEEDGEEQPATRIYHVDTENNVVDDMEATVEENGALSMETDHFSIFSLDGETEERETEDASTEASEGSEEGLGDSEENLEGSEEGLESSEESLEGSEEGLGDSEESLEGSEEGLESSEESLEGSEESLGDSEESLEGSEEGLESSEENLEGSEEGLGDSEESLEGSEEGLEAAEGNDDNVDVDNGDGENEIVVPIADNRSTFIVLAQDGEWGEIWEKADLDKAVEDANNGKISQYRLMDNIQITEDAWYRIEKEFTLDLNGKKITYQPTKATALKDDAFLFSVGTNGGASGKLTILDSTGKPSEVVEDVTGTFPLYGNVAEYDDVNKTLIYYVTESKANDDKVGTTERLLRHTVDLSEVGAIEGTGIDILQLIRIVAGEFNLEGGRLTNGVYGHAIKTASTEVTKANNYTINIRGGYIVGNTVWGEGGENQKYQSTGGNAQESGWGGPYGAGIMLNYGTGTNTLNIIGGVIAANQSKYGGGLYVEAACSVFLGGNAVIAGNEAGVKSKTEQGISGGGMYLNPKGKSCEISGECYITNNVSWDEYQPEKEGNEVYGTYGGGGIYAGNPDSKIVVSGGYITGNSASAGGGIFLGNKKAWGIENSSLEITGGYIASNQARDGEGGGVRIPSTDSCLIEAADGRTIYITNNRTDLRQNWGGGGVYVASGGTLKIINPLIINNTARGFGGGITGCSAGHVYLADGITSDGDGVAAIFDNIAKADNFAGDFSSKHEDREAFQNDIFRQSGYQDVFCAMFSSFSNTMLGGGKENWKGSKNYEQLTEADRNGNSVSASVILGMSADPTTEDEKKAKDFIKEHGGVVISGNYSNIHGGGILCNGIMTIGDVDRMDLDGGLKIEFYKKYTDGSGNSQDLAAGQFEFALISAQKMRDIMGSKAPGDYYHDKKDGNCINSQKLIRRDDGIYYDDVDVTDAVLHTTTNLTDGSAVFSLDLAAVSNSNKNNNYNNDEYHYYLMEIRDDRKEVTNWSTEAYEIWVTVESADKTRTVLDEKIAVKYYYVQMVEVQYYKYGAKDGDYKAVKGKKESDNSYNSVDDWLQGEYLGIKGLLEDWSHPAKVTLSYLEGTYKNESFTNKGDKSYVFVIRKIDSETKEVMSNVEFTLQKLNVTPNGKKGTVIEGKEQKNQTVSGYADFVVLPGESYLLTEEVPEGYQEAGPWWVEVKEKGNGNKVDITLHDAVAQEDGNWEKGKGSVIKRTESTIESEKDKYAFYYQIENIPEEAYTLPETGGSGTTLYTMAGICVLLTAGLLYKKQIRERRLKASRN